MKFMLAILLAIWHVNNANLITYWGFCFIPLSFSYEIIDENFLLQFLLVFFFFFSYFFSDFQVVEYTGFIDLCLINCKKKRREVRTPYDHLLLKQNTSIKNIVCSLLQLRLHQLPEFYRVSSSHHLIILYEPSATGLKPTYPRFNLSEAKPRRIEAEASTKRETNRSLKVAHICKGIVLVW
jgi:hypothetical protein